MKFTNLAVFIFIFIYIYTGTSQGLLWNMVELTPSLSNASGKIEYVEQGEIVFLTGGELFHAHYGNDFNVDVVSFENQLTLIKDFFLIDVDWDGDKDIMAVIEGGPIQVYEKKENVFIYNVNIKIFSWINVNSLSIHDFNDDGRGDILLNNILYIATGPNMFERTYTTNADNYIPRVAQFFDADMDGDKDLLTVLVTNLFIHENIGTTGMSGKLVPDFSHRTSWAKVIRAGNKDIIIVFSGGDKKFYRIFYENNTFGHKEIGGYIQTKQTNSIVNKDLDDDGVEELISDQYFNQLTLLKYDTLLDTLTLSTYSAPNFLDFTGGGQNQLFIRYAGQIESVLWDKTQNKLVRSFISPTVFSPSEYLDIDGDDFVDLVKGISIKRYLGERRFDIFKTMNIDSTGGQWKDFDGDEDLDYVLKYGWYMNIGGLQFDPYQSRTPDPVFTDPLIFFTKIVFREDLDGDGDIDVLTYNSFGEPFELHENTGGVFSLKQTLATNTIISGYLRALYFEDFDGDGKKDILIAVASGMAWMKNYGSLVFGEPKLLYNGANSPLMVDISDVNHDGIMDVLLSTGVIITGIALGSVILYLGSQDANVTGLPITQGYGYHRARFADLNSTGWKDIVFSKKEGMHTVLLDNITSPVINRINFDAGSNNNFNISDLDGDGDADIISASASGSSFYIINGVFISNACPSGSVFLRNQEQVSAYAEKYGMCPVIPGDLFLGLAKKSDSDIQDISGLQNIKKIQGNLTIHYSPLIKEFSGFINLDTIEGSFILQRFTTKNLKGFDNLTYVGNHLELTHTHTAQSLLLDTRELGKVKFVGGDIKLLSPNFTNLGIQSQPEYFGDIILTSYTDNALTNIDFLKNTRKIHGSLNLETCQVTTLEPAKNLEEVGEFIIRSEKLQTIGMGSEIDSINGSLEISGTNLVDLFSDSSFANLKYVGKDLDLYAKYMRGFSNVEKVMGTLSPNGKTIDFGFLEKLDYVGKNFFMSGVEKIYPGFLQRVDSIGGYFNFLNNSFPDLTFLSNIKKAKSFDLNLNNSIVSLDGLHPDLKIEGRLLIWRCANLNFCDVPFVCKHIADGKPYHFNKNGQQCNDPADFDCLSNSFSGLVFYDQNQNGIRDMEEFPVSGQNISAFGKPNTVYTSANGKYNLFFLPNDSVNIGMNAIEPFRITTTPERYTGRFIPEQPDNKDNNFGIFHRYPKHNGSISGQFGLFVCNRPAELDIQVLNQGSFVEKTRVKVQLPNNIMLDSLEGITYEYDQNQSIVWLKTDTLQPFQREKITLWVTAPAWDPSSDNKYPFFWELQVLNASGQWMVMDDEDKMMELLCSYDPNDKLVEGPYKGSNLLFGQSGYLDYTIRFQNTGNYYAENVFLADTLSSNLNVDSLEFIASSHEPMEITRNGNILKFYFPGIMLPDSTRDFAGSQGYVRFKIKTNEAMDPDDVINNTAHIYFDFNPAITTNTVSSLVLQPDYTEEYENMSIVIWPQPAIDKLLVQLNGESLSPDWECKIYSQSGGLVFPVQNLLASYIDISSLASGKYWLVFENGLTGKKTTRGFVKM